MTTKSFPSARPRHWKARRIPKTTTDRARRPRPVFVAIGLGSNEGNREKILRRVRRDLAAHLRDVRSSPFYETSPVGGPAAQPDFLNAVVVGWTKLSAPALFTFLRESEFAAGRSRARGARNGPRPLDLDLLLYGNEQIRSRALTVPHPRMTSRLFVLVPLADVAARRVVPGTGKTVGRLLDEARLGSTESVRPVGP
ncbi:MAG: 2-amino-4-hydroxy-6-hydroxymethyldihydropteridine diphosphokinase [Thermoanaerobaculia bacterium]|nr:2-amino-4-hydroxy-6-hydroxymethyldihydropteridine diphosphokinase [Thermoanaerobaculia bacterium]